MCSRMGIREFDNSLLDRYLWIAGEYRARGVLAALHCDCLWKLGNWARILAGWYYMLGLLSALVILRALFFALFDPSELAVALLGAALCG